MATQNLGKTITILANEDLSSYQFRFMKINSSAKATLCGEGEAACGVLQNDPAAANRGADVMVGTGQTKVVAGAAASCGDWVASDSVGRAVVASSSDHILGQFLEAPGEAGDVVSVLFQRHPATL